MLALTLLLSPVPEKNDVSMSVQNTACVNRRYEGTCPLHIELFILRVACCTSRLESVHVRQIHVSFAGKDAEEASKEEQQVQQWRLTPEQAGPVRMLQWGGISRSTPQWPSRWGMLYRGILHLLENETSAEPLESLNIWNNRWELRS